MPKESLCVGTVFPDCSPRCRQWLDLQLRYLKATTPEGFSHTTVVHLGDVTPFFANNTHVLRPTAKPIKVTQGRGSRYHVRGLNMLAKHFAKQKGCKSFLLLDMDAFPIRMDWLTKLPRLMQNVNPAFEVAIPIRYECQETRFHSSIVFGPAAKLPQLRWVFGSVGTNLIGTPETDVQLLPYQTDKHRDKVFVMLRSNKYQVHPELCGVYCDLFYHNGATGAGRSQLKFNRYWKHIGTQDFQIRDVAEQLFKDPNAFISQLAGWSTEQYATI